MNIISKQKQATIQVGSSPMLFEKLYDKLFDYKVYIKW